MTDALERRLYENGKQIGPFGLDLWAVIDDAIQEDARRTAHKAMVAKARAEDIPTKDQEESWDSALF